MKSFKKLFSQEKEKGVASKEKEVLKKRATPLTSLAEFMKDERSKINQKLLEKELDALLGGNEIRELLFAATDYLQLDLKPEEMSKTGNFLLHSNLPFMRDAVASKENLTLGADPEFILCDARDPSRTVLLSSKHRLPHIESDVGLYSLSELAVGADYGLLELRPAYEKNSASLVSNVNKLLSSFKEVQDGLLAPAERDEDDEDREVDEDMTEAIAIQEVEAVEFAHKRQRLLEIIEGGELDFGIGSGGKYNQVAAASGSADIGLTASELYGISISAYDEPVFAQGNDGILTAGGHLHFGGRRLRLFNIQQLKELVKKFDEALLPMCAKVETPMAELRRKYYGAPGEFRLKEYGIEYRSLSSAIFWPKNHVVLKEVLNKAIKIILDFHKNY